jgi:hypothetical protein
LNVDWNDNCFKPILAMELKTSGKTVSLTHKKKQMSKEVVVVQLKEMKQQRAGRH